MWHRLFNKVILAAGLLALFPPVNAQNTGHWDSELRKRFAFMLKDNAGDPIVVATAEKIHFMMRDAGGKLVTDPGIVVYSNEYALLGNILGQMSLRRAALYYLEKSSRNLAGEMLKQLRPQAPFRFAGNPDRPLEGLKIALDPGHFAHNERIAKLEKKYLKIRASDLGRTEDVFIYEAHLTALTAIVLEEMLRVKGAQVLVTRGPGKSATGKNFDEWYRDDFRNDLEEARRNNDITEKVYQEVLAAASSEKKVLSLFFKDLELRKRADMINAFRPHLTLVMHYNIDENNVPDKSGYHFLHDKNYSMTFVGGAYTRKELTEPLDRMFFLRQLLGGDVTASVGFSQYVQDAIVSILQVPAYREEFPLSYIRDYSVRSAASEGIYHRNLYLTQSIYGALAFAEPLLQDNREEAQKLSTDNCEWKGTKLPCRLVEMATAYCSAIESWAKEQR